MAEEFRIGIGGPLYRVERAAHINRLGRLVAVFIGASWAPLLLLTLGERLTTGAPEPMLRDPAVHVRLVLALPLFLVAERSLDRLASIAVARLFGEGIVRAAEAVRFRVLLDRVARWRDSAWPEALLLALGLAVGVAALLGVSPGSPIGAGTRHHAVRVWYALVSLPLFQFVLWRSLFRWALWVRVLIGLSRIRLRLLPAHADRRAGIGFVKTPGRAYWAIMLLAVSSVLSAGWATQIRSYGARLQTFASAFVILLLIGLVATLVPLLMFVPQLVRARIAGACQFGALVSDYTQRFETRWIGPGDHSELLGTPDLQSLADLGHTFRENVEQMGVFLFDMRDLILLLVAAVVPLVPLLFLQAPANEVLRKLLRLVAGGLSG